MARVEALKTILYLDQNYVSHLTKARLGVKVNLAAYYENLYDALRDAVAANAIVCPASQFHYAESELDTRLAPEIYHTLEELYCGVEFRGFDEIIEAQAVAALHDFLGVPHKPGPKWHEAFSKDPHSRFEGKIEPIDRSGSGAFAELSRATKASHEKDQREPEPVGNLERQKRFEARQYISWLYYLPLLSLALGSRDIFTFFGLGPLADLLRAYRELLGRDATSEDPLAFLASEQMMAAPFIDVYSSLRAAMVIDRDRKTRGSDLNDVLIAATVLPYCDVFATDGHVKQLLLALKLDKRYKVTVFGSRKADVLELTSLVRELSSGEPPVSLPPAPPA